jgi:hypothetical protein
LANVDRAPPRESIRLNTLSNTLLRVSTAPTERGRGQGFASGPCRVRHPSMMARNRPVQPRPDESRRRRTARHGGGRSGLPR